MNKNTDITTSEVRDFVNSNGINGLETADGFTVYFAKGQLIYELRYDIGIREKASYPNIFKMIIESFIFTQDGA